MAIDHMPFYTSTLGIYGITTREKQGNAARRTQGRATCTAVLSEQIIQSNTGAGKDAQGWVVTHSDDSMPSVAHHGYILGLFFNDFIS